METISQWADQWKMLSDPEPSKQATEALFSRKINSNDCPKLKFNFKQVQQSSLHKHQGRILPNNIQFH